MSTARLDDDFWTDLKVEKMTPEEKLLFIWLFTNPYRNWTGIYKLPLPMIPEHTGLDLKSIRNGIETLLNLEVISYDEVFKMVFVKSMLKRQMGIGEETLSEKQKKGILNHLKTLHNCPLIQEFLEKYSHLNLVYEHTPLNGLSNEVSNTHSNPTDTKSQSQSQSQSQNQSGHRTIRGQSRDKPAQTDPEPVFIEKDFFYFSKKIFEMLRKKAVNYSDYQFECLLDDLDVYCLEHPEKYSRTPDGKLKAPASVISSWLKIAPTPRGPADPPEPPEPDYEIDQNCPKCRGMGIVIVTDPKTGRDAGRICSCRHVKNDPNYIPCPPLENEQPVFPDPDCDVCGGKGIAKTTSENGSISFKSCGCLHSIEGDTGEIGKNIISEVVSDIYENFKKKNKSNLRTE